MFTAISPITSSISVLSKEITPEALTEYKNLMLGTPGLTTSSHIIIDNAQIIWIHPQAFASGSDT